MGRAAAGVRGGRTKWRPRGSGVACQPEAVAVAAAGGAGVANRGGPRDGWAAASGLATTRGGCRRLQISRRTGLRRPEVRRRRPKATLLASKNNEASILQQRSASVSSSLEENSLALLTCSHESSYWSALGFYFCQDSKPLRRFCYGILVRFVLNCCKFAIFNMACTCQGNCYSNLFFFPFHNMVK